MSKCRRGNFGVGSGKKIRSANLDQFVQDFYHASKRRRHRGSWIDKSGVPKRSDWSFESESQRHINIAQGLRKKEMRSSKTERTTGHATLSQGGGKGPIR